MSKTRTPPPRRAPTVREIGLQEYLEKLSASLYEFWNRAGNFRSVQLTIGDDEVSQVVPPLFGGFLLITTNLDDPQEAMSGLIYFDVGSTLAITKQTTAANLDVSTSDVTGTTGTNGNVTVAVQSEVVKIENRSGSACQFRVSFL